MNAFFITDKSYIVLLSKYHSKEEIALLKLSLETPIIFLCKDGKDAIKNASKLETIGYKNIFVIAGGLQQLLKDSKS